MSYVEIKTRLDAGQTIILDGAVGTELERRGVAMNPEAWCGIATLDNTDILRQIHLDYIEAGAQVITANTYASSPMMLTAAGFMDRFEEINQAAVRVAVEAREASRLPGIAVAGAVSHMVPIPKGREQAGPAAVPSPDQIRDGLTQQALSHAKTGCDLILLEMMFHPDRMGPALDAAAASGLPVWAGLSARRGDSGEVLAFTSDRDIPFAEIVQILNDYQLDAAGVMHSESAVTGDALAILSQYFDGPLMAYPDSGYFTMPEWQFQDIIPPADLCEYARGWRSQGAQILGGCCGLSPEHIEAIAVLA